MLHDYVAGVPEWPHIPILERMYHEKCYICILRARPSRRSHRCLKECLMKNAISKMCGCSRMVALPYFAKMSQPKLLFVLSGWLLPKTKRHFASDVSAENAHFY